MPSTINFLKILTLKKAPLASCSSSFLLCAPHLFAEEFEWDICIVVKMQIKISWPGTEIIMQDESWWDDDEGWVMSGCNNKVGKVGKTKNKTIRWQPMCS